MIKRIKRIQNLGVFRDFSWSSNNQLKDLNEKNVFYGWNYSGKTTLSRIFSSLRDKQMHPDYAGANFQLTLDDGTELSGQNIATSSIKVAVFNTEYVSRSLSWESQGELGEPIAFDVGENVSIREEISELEEKMERVENRANSHKPAKEEFAEFESWRFTQESKNISLLVFGAERQFDKGAFKRVQRNLNENLNDHRIDNDQELETVKKEATAINSFTKIDKVNFDPVFSFLQNRVAEILEECPEKDVVIQKLEVNKSLYKWAKDGLEFEENHSECSFCGNEVSEDRINELNSYFSNASKVVRDKILSLRKEIEEEIKAISEVEVPKSQLEFVEKHQEDGWSKVEELTSLKARYIDSLGSLNQELERKEDGNVFNSLTINPIDSEVNSLNTWCEEINEIIESHNQFVENFASVRNEARRKLEKHLVASYLIDNDYATKEEKKNQVDRYLNRFVSIYRTLRSKKEEKEDSLKTITKGKDELNKFIKKFLNRDDIKIEVTDNDKFVLHRNNHPASNLSEGEKTAISFSYFLVSLESLNTNAELSEQRRTIVYIDDPISSLDNNHIAQVYSLINAFFFRKNVDANNPNKVINCFAQLFISTHNFEFFTFLKDAKRLNKRVDNKPTCSYYFIKKIDSQNSVINPLPKSLSKYKSEYIYLFEILYGYKVANENGQETEDILLPNAMRRFLEIYTLMKIPSEPASVESRINELVDDVNQFKLLNHFSHFTTFEKLTKHDELLMILPDACSELFKLLEEDPLHYQSLKKSIGV